jgi:serine/threonine protein kinase
MGDVYRARDITLGRDVALKCLRPGLTTDREARRRFIGEAEAVSALDHPNVCTAFSIGETADGTPFFAMPLCEGITLKTRLASGPLRPAEAIEIATQVARGLQAAHDAGIVHRDVKPDNLVIRSDGMVKILDFGVAKLDAAVTMTSATVVGTLGYMAPEQLSGDCIDRRADVWALGVVLYEMLSGERPFTGRGILAQILADAPAPLRTRCTDVSPALEELVLRALRKAPEDRFQSMDRLVAALEALRDPAPTGQMPRTHLRWSGRARRSGWSKPTSWVVALASILVGLVALLGQGPAPGQPVSMSGWVGPGLARTVSAAPPSKTGRPPAGRPRAGGCPTRSGSARAPPWNPSARRGIARGSAAPSARGTPRRRSAHPA